MDAADRLAVVDVAVDYAGAIDTRDWKLLAAQFTPDATWSYPGMIETVTGPERIVETIRAGLRGLDATQHLLGNHRVTVRGEQAGHTCYFQAQHVRLGAPGGDTFLGAGRYTDVLRRTPEGWKLVSRELAGMWSQGNLAVFRPDLPAR